MEAYERKAKYFWNECYYATEFVQNYVPFRYSLFYIPLML